jgi:peptidoglycan hydrolase-like amidase
MASKLAIAIFALPLFAADMRIGVLSLFRPERLTIRSNQTLWVQAGPRTFFLTPGEVAGLRGVGTEVDLFAQRQLTASPNVKISGRGGVPIAFSLGIEGKIDRTFTGRLEVKAVGSRLEPVILIDLESAVAAAVAAEMPRDAGREALKAMAVLARSYYTASSRRHGPYDFCDTTHCQWRRETVSATHPASMATKDTAGIILTYKDRPLAAMYHSSCGGETKTAEQVGLSADPYPYFPVVCDPCRRDSPTWTRKLPIELARPILTTISESMRLMITRQLGWDALPSNNYTAHMEGNEVVVNGRGEGHGVGVCQRGISNSGSDDFRALLSRYLPQTRTGQ